jgi:hypothetical protein
METSPLLIRQCKQCDKVMTEPLKVGDKLYLFCSTECRTTWDHEHAYKMKPPGDLDVDLD